MLSNYLKSNDVPVHQSVHDRMPIPERERARNHYDRAAPVRTPTLVGCAFAIDREFFFEIGSYDTGMNIWGSENMEMSLRVLHTPTKMTAASHNNFSPLYRCGNAEVPWN